MNAPECKSLVCDIFCLCGCLLICAFAGQQLQQLLGDKKFSIYWEVLNKFLHFKYVLKRESLVFFFLG
jgi:hypothetical protein